MLISLYDLKPSGVLGKDKYGYVVPVTFEGADAMLRDYITDLPDGEIVDIIVDRLHDLVTFKYRCAAGATAPRVGQAREWPHRGGGA